MTGLRDRFDELAAETPVYGDVDRAIRTVSHRRRRNGMLGVAVACALALVGGTLTMTRDEPAKLRPLDPPASAEPTGPSFGALPDGDVTPGRYRFDIYHDCEVPNCPKPLRPESALQVTVPAGWNSAGSQYVSLFPMDGRDRVSVNEPALVLGWTNHQVGLISQPCSPVSDPKPDIKVGPTVDDFVEAVQAHPKLNVTEPKPVKLGRHKGQFFTLQGPADISKCEEWRPWDPSPYLQGPSNIWNLWVMNVDGVRIVIMIQYFPNTPAPIKAELRRMAESVRFV